MAESTTKLDEEVRETVVEQPPEPNPIGAPPLTPEELVAKCIAPVKPNFLRPRPPRQSSRNDDVASGQNPNDKSFSTVIAKEKKSKRQLKRERLQEKKSAAHICPGIAKTGDVNSCPYNEKCRFSHDLEAFKAQKPDDLEGECPFSDSQGSCPYGISCRFYGTHRASDGSSNVVKETAEINGLKSEVRKLLWKNKMKFPKADAVLVSLGVANKESHYSKSKEKDEKEIVEGVAEDSHTANENCCGDVANDSADKMECSEVPSEGNADSVLANDELRHPKKAKSDAGEEWYSGVEANGSSVLEKENNFKDCCQEAEPKIITTDGEPEPKIIATVSVVTETDRFLKSHPREKKLIDFREKLYLAPLTTVGNLPFRRVCKVFGADVTCGEMAMCTNLLQGQASEWALLRRHSSEDLFGVQICGAFPDTVARTLELIDQECTVDFIDINMGCPIDIVVNKGAGSALLTKPMRMKSIIEAASATVEKPITIKVRTGYFEGKNRIDSLIADIGNWGASAVTIHGRTRQQRYSKLADWDYVYQCARKAPDSLPVLGNGDVFSYMDWNRHNVDCPELSSCMIARGALIKPWIFTEIKEQRHWDISSGERLDILKDFTRYGLEHWGSDTKGVETTRHFLLEWLSYTFRYIPIGLLDVIPQRLNWRPPAYYGRDDLETLMASDSAADWIRISEMLLGKVPEGFTFAPKHKSNAYDVAENG